MSVKTSKAGPEIVQWAEMRIVLVSGAELRICLDMEAAEGYAQQLMSSANGVITIRGKRTDNSFIVFASFRVHPQFVAAVDIQLTDKIVFHRCIQPSDIEAIADGKPS